MLPDLYEFFEFLCSMDSCVVKHYHRQLGNGKRHVVKHLDDEISVHGLFGGAPYEAAAPRQQPETVEGLAPAGWHAHFFVVKLPSVGHIALLGEAGLVAVKQVDVAIFRLLFQQLEGLLANLVLLRVGLALNPQSDTLPSALKFFKKRLSVT